jgi:hypothetical protein
MTQALRRRSIRNPLAVYRAEPAALTFAGYPPFNPRRGAL